MITFSGHSAIFANLVLAKTLTRDQLLELPVYLALQRDTPSTSATPDPAGFVRVQGNGFEILVPQALPRRHESKITKIAVIDDAITTGEAILLLKNYLQHTLKYEESNIDVGCFVCHTLLTQIPERRPNVWSTTTDSHRYNLPWGPSIFFPRPGQ